MAHHQQLLDWIENNLINRTLALGDNLPDDRKLTRELGISQNQVRESLKYYEEIGILTLYEGRKKSIIGQLVKEPAVSAAPAVGLYLASSQQPVQDLLNTSLLLEGYALAQDRQDPARYQQLEEILTQMQDAATSINDFHELEADFHIQLGWLSGNPLIPALLASLRQALLEARFDLSSRVPLWSSTATRLRLEYQAILDAARSQDPALAQALLRANLLDRFADSGQDLSLDQLEEQEASSASFSLEPLDVETGDLLPSSWQEAIEPDLFEALTSIQPLKPSQ